MNVLIQVVTLKILNYPKSVSKWNCMFCPFKEDKETMWRRYNLLISLYMYNKCFK